MSTEPARPSQVVTPVEPVRPRRDAIVDRAIVHLTGDAAAKENVFPSDGGSDRGMRNMQTQLRVGAWVRNLTFAKSVWLDVHLFGRDGLVLHTETLPLRFTRATSDDGALFEFDGVVFQGSVSTQGTVDARPDARALQYRLYCEQDARVYTDGLAHWCELRGDAAGA